MLVLISLLTSFEYTQLYALYLLNLFAYFFMKSKSLNVSRVSQDYCFYCVLFAGSAWENLRKTFTHKNCRDILFIGIAPKKASSVII